MPGTSLVRLLLLGCLIVAVALGLGLLDVEPVWIVVGVIAAWLVASVVEWTLWQRDNDPWRSRPAPPAQPRQYSMRVPVGRKRVVFNLGADPAPAPPPPIEETIVEAPAPAPEPVVVEEPPPPARARARS